MFKKISIDQTLYFGLLIFLLMRLWFVGNFFSHISCLLLALLSFGIWLYFGKETKWRQRIKIVFPALSVPILYLFLGKIVSFLQLSKIDESLQQIDHWLIGESLSLKISVWIHPVFTELMFIVYMLFFYYIISSFIHYAKRNDRITKSFYAGFFSIYWIGFLFYIITPGEGPFFAMPEVFEKSLTDGILITKPICNMLNNAMNRTDVFPSLHCSLSAFCLLFDCSHRKKRFYFSVIFVVLIWLSTIYLRYHYFIDCIAGFALTFFALVISKKVLRSFEIDKKGLEKNYEDTK